MSDPQPVISVDGVTKHFRLKGQGRTLKSVIVDLLRSAGRERGPKRFCALDNVSFQAHAGETLGIIGANGAGKSTLLSIVAQTMQPTLGGVSTRGTISSLLELGAGFHPDLTGRENVYLYGAIMGIPHERMKARFDAIVEFSGIRDFIDQPVKHYSSGMYVRLGFAVAVEVDPDVLLIDEVLAVGDEDFQRRCLAKMSEFRERGKTMLIISHDLQTIQSISDRILFLDHGQVKGIGDPETLVSRYQHLSRERRSEHLRREWGTGEIRIVSVELFGVDGTPCETYSQAGLRARVHYEAGSRIESPVFGFGIADPTGRVVHGSNTQLAGMPLKAVEGKGTLELVIDQLPLAKGTYLLSFSVHSADHKINYHRLDHCFPIAVDHKRVFDGCSDLPSHWECPTEETRS